MNVVLGCNIDILRALAVVPLLISYEGEIEEKRAQLSETNSELERATSSYEQAEDTANTLQSNIDHFLQQERQVMTTVTAKKAVLSRLNRILEGNNHEELEQSAIDIERQLLASSNLIEQLKGVIDDVQVGCAHMTRMALCAIAS